jgi:hypothetical protein
MSGVSVRGGSNGIEAHFDDLTALARLFGAAATTLAGHALSLHRYLVDPDVLSSAALDPYGAGRFTAALLDALDGPHGLSWLGAECGAKDLRLRTAATSYYEADRLRARFAPAVQGILDGASLVPNSIAGAVAGHPLAAINHAIAGQADIVTAAASGFWTNWALINAVSTYPDGRPVVHATGADDSTAADTVPRSLTDVLSELSHRSDHRAGGDIDVRFVYSTGADGRTVRHVIVDIPGVDTLNPSPTAGDPTSFGTSLRTLTGARSTYGDGVLEAMRQAGVTPGDPVLLVGHSQGGMVAMNLAKQLAGRGTFDITNVITVGSPVAHITVPRSVRVLAIENDGDFVPHLDGASNPDRTNWTTVTIHREHIKILDNHDLGMSYVPGAGDIDASSNPSVRSYLAGLSGFLGGNRVQTRVFSVRRRAPRPEPDRETRRSTDPRAVR